MLQRRHFELICSKTTCIIYCKYSQKQMNAPGKLYMLTYTGLASLVPLWVFTKVSPEFCFLLTQHGEVFLILDICGLLGIYLSLQKLISSTSLADFTSFINILNCTASKTVNQLIRKTVGPEQLYIPGEENPPASEKPK